MKGGIDFIVDTNVLIYVMEGHSALSHILRCSPCISVISEIELLGKKGVKPAELSEIRSLLIGFTIVDFNDIIKDITISLRQKYSIKTPDAIVAATAKACNLPLVTADKGFSKIDDIEVILLNLDS